MSDDKRHSGEFMKENLASHLVGYFNPQVLAAYRSEPDKYVIETDDFTEPSVSRTDISDRFKLRASRMRRVPAPLSADRLRSGGALIHFHLGTSHGRVVGIVQFHGLLIGEDHFCQAMHI
jgi:hypothetical protein